MTEERYDIWICQDCLMYHANGEEPQMTNDEVEEWLARIERNTNGYDVTLGRVYGGDGCECVTAVTSLMESIAETMAAVTEMIAGERPDWDAIIGRLHYETCERNEFSSSSCGMCGTNLAGSRDAATLTAK